MKEFEFNENVSEQSDPNSNTTGSKGLRVNNNDIYEVFPVIPLRGITIFPHTVVHFDIGREQSINALERAMATDKMLFVSSQKDDNILLPKIEDIYQMGTIVKVKQMLKIQGDAVRVLVEGICRANMIECIPNNDCFTCTASRIEEKRDEESLTTEVRAKIRVTENIFAEYAAQTGQVSEDITTKVLSIKDPISLIDNVANELYVETKKKQQILEALNLEERIDILNAVIAEENEIAALEKKLAQDVKQNVDTNQKEYYLREKMKAIQSELGSDEDAEAESLVWLVKLDELKLDEKIDEKIRKEIKKFNKMMPSSAESGVIRNYIEAILDLPWNKESEINFDIKRAEKILDEDHYGMKKVKERILEYLAVTHLSKGIKGPIICLVGPPGVGKTSIAKSIARATGREYVRMSLGGVRDEAEIRGHRRTYIGAIPGRIINSIKDCGTKNPLFLFDEIDKLGADYKGDPSSALLEVLDPEQNNSFTDHFLEVPFDLSKVMFITTANNADTIPGPLLDRMELIEVPGYTEAEKVEIAKRYLVPKQIKENGLKEENLHVTEPAIHDLVNYYTRESGVRNLEREIASLCRKVAKRVVSEGDKKYMVNPKNLTKYLGKHRFSYDQLEEQNEVGLVTGLAWTSVGGVTLQIEVAVLPGTGKLQLTGQLGDVMQESARAAFSYARTVASEYGIDKEFFEKNDLHIHIPEGAVPKDGPSAGVTMFTAIMSAITNSAVKKDVAMTGEITLRGKVLPVGGIREKVLAAHRAGIKKILLPKKNEADMEELPQNVRKDVEFVLISDAKEALKQAFADSSEK